MPPKVVRQRFRDQILHDVAHGLIPRAVDEALRERGVEPVNTPDIRDVVVEEGQPLKFTATFETVPAIDPGDYSSLTLRRKDVAVDDVAVGQALADCGNAPRATNRSRGAASRCATRWCSIWSGRRRRKPARGRRRRPARRNTDRHDNVTVDIGATANPPWLR